MISRMGVVSALLEFAGQLMTHELDNSQFGEAMPTVRRARKAKWQGEGGGSGMGRHRLFILGGNGNHKDFSIFS